VYAHSRSVVTQAYRKGTKDNYDVFGVASYTVSTYDSEGNLIEEEFSRSGSGYRSVHTYDAQGKRVTTTQYSDRDPGLGIEKTVLAYDARGNITELTTYYTQRAGDKEVRPIPPPNKRVYTYEFDAHGNWVKQTMTLCSAESGKPVCEPSLVTYRTITYYPEAAGREP
jgi:hypothetical protein